MIRFALDTATSRFRVTVGPLKGELFTISVLRNELGRSNPRPVVRVGAKGRKAKWRGRLNPVSS
jgi:hypothetical protein